MASRVKRQSMMFEADTIRGWWCIVWHPLKPNKHGYVSIGEKTRPRIGRIVVGGER